MYAWSYAEMGEGIGRVLSLWAPGSPRMAFTRRTEGVNGDQNAEWFL